CCVFAHPTLSHISLRSCEPTLPPWEVSRVAVMFLAWNSLPMLGPDAAESSAAGVLGLAEADVLKQGGRHGRYLLAVGGAGNRDRGLVEGSLRADRPRVEIAEQFGNECTVLAVAIIGNLARRGGGKDQGIVRRGDRRKAMGKGTEAPLIRVA